jgi:hypothetical protein
MPVPAPTTAAPTHTPTHVPTHQPTTQPTSFDDVVTGTKLSVSTFAVLK